jgi:hypothetical protein
MEQDVSQPDSKRPRLRLYIAALAVLIGSLLLFKFHLVLYVLAMILIAFGGGPTYVRYWKRGRGLEATLFVGALIAGGLVGVAWEQLS